MIGVDTSYLVALAVREHAAHRACWRLFEAEIVGGTATMAIAPQALAEFCHVVTDPRRFERPLDMPAALELCEDWWNTQECRPVTVDEEVTALFLVWMHELRLGRKQLLDAAGGRIGAALAWGAKYVGDANREGLRGLGRELGQSIDRAGDKATNAMTGLGTKMAIGMVGASALHAFVMDGTLRGACRQRHSATPAGIGAP